MATKLFVAFCAACLIGACEDSATLDFKEEYYVEGFLIVGEPVQDVRIQRTQSLTAPFQVANGKVTDATVRLFVGDASTPILLTYRADTTGVTIGDYVALEDTVRAETRYRLEVVFADGKRVEAETQTPKQIEWILPPRPLVQFPPVSQPNLRPDSLRVAWTPASPTAEYLIRTTCLDTLDYGVYLASPTAERNRRTWSETDEGTGRINARSVWSFLQATSTSTVWSAFKWYGRHEVALYAADVNFSNWFKLTTFLGAPEYNRAFSNVRGDGRGIFGSASVLKQATFVLKD